MRVSAHACSLPLMLLLLLLRLWCSCERSSLCRCHENHSVLSSRVHRGHCLCRSVTLTLLLHGVSHSKASLLSHAG